MKYALPTENTRYDPTLLRTSKLTCINDECETKRDLAVKPEFILTNKSTTDRLMNITCTTCGVSWT